MNCDKICHKFCGKGFSAGSGVRRGSALIPASQEGWNLANILTRCSGLTRANEEDQSIWLKCQQGFNPVVKLVLENCSFS